MKKYLVQISPDPYDIIIVDEGNIESAKQGAHYIAECNTKINGDKKMTIEFIKTVMTIKIAKCDTSLPRHYFKFNGKVFILSSMFGRTSLLDEDGYPYQDSEILNCLVSESKSLNLGPVDGHDW